MQSITAVPFRGSAVPSTSSFVNALPYRCTASYKYAASALIYSKVFNSSLRSQKNKTSTTHLPASQSRNTSTDWENWTVDVPYTNWRRRWSFRNRTDCSAPRRCSFWRLVERRGGFRRVVDPSGICRGFRCRIVRCRRRPRNIRLCAFFFLFKFSYHCYNGVLKVFRRFILLEFDEKWKLLLLSGFGVLKTGWGI